MTWREQLQAAREQGYDVLDWLSASDDPLTITACLIRSQNPGEHRLITASAPVQTVVDLFPSAAWHERETAEMFGVKFAGGDDRPLLTQDGDGPLRKAAPLPARTDQPWPGAVDPAKPRRVQRPPGTPWT